MDALLFFFILIALGIFFAIKVERHIAYRILLIITIFFAVGIIIDWNFVDKQFQYEQVDKIPFTLNPSDGKYYIFHENEFKKCETHVEGFNEKFLDKPEYDSCYVYKVHMPTIMLFLKPYATNDKFQYRQSEDIILKNREKKTITLSDE